MQPGRAPTSGLGVPPPLLARSVGWVAPMSPTLGVWLVVARPSVALGAHVCAVSWATWLLYIGVPARCVLPCVRCPGPLGSCSPVCPVCALSCMCGVLGNLAPVHQCACSVLCVECAVSWATWLLFTGVPAPCVVLCVRWPWPLGSCSPVCPLRVLCRVCGVLGHLAPVHRCARSSCCVSCALSWATWLLFTGVLARGLVLCVRSPGPLGSCSPMWPPVGSCRVCGLLGLVFTGFFGSVGCVACAVSWDTCVRFSATYNGQFLPMLIGTFSALFLLYFYTNFSGKQSKIPLKSVFLRLRRGQNGAVADGFWSFSDYDLKQFNYFF